MLARRASRASAGQGQKSAQDTWAEVVRRFDAELAPHFLIEEQVLLPALERLGEKELVARTRAEHAQLRELVQGDTHSLESRLEEFGSLLREHVRFEERTLFPVVQERVPAEVLDAVDRACRQVRTPPG